LSTPASGVEWVGKLREQLSIPPLWVYGITSVNVPDLVEKAAEGSSMKANPIVLTAAELTDVMERAL
jgi:alcohol dehydrogenase class IV